MCVTNTLYHLELEAGVGWPFDLAPDFTATMSFGKLKLEGFVETEDLGLAVSISTTNLHASLCMIVAALKILFDSFFR